LTGFDRFFPLAGLLSYPGRPGSGSARRASPGFITLYKTNNNAFPGEIIVLNKLSRKVVVSLCDASSELVLVHCIMIIVSLCDGIDHCHRRIVHNTRKICHQSLNESPGANQVLPWRQILVSIPSDFTFYDKGCNLKYFFILKYIKIIYFYFFKIIFYISVSK
jgi:hypothetical protein